MNNINMFSDTVTLPTTKMKEAMLIAPIGDEQRQEDPTTVQLEQQMANLLGQECAIFLPSATMANIISIRLLCNPGDELFGADQCHLFYAEAGGPAIHSGVMTRPIQTASGIFTGDQLREAYRWFKGPHHPLSKCVSIENTTNMGGGLAWELNEIKSVLSAAKELNLNTHLDGSRLFNAAIKHNLTPKEIASSFDAVTICLSKGLGCPMGAILAFKEKHYLEVRRLKQLFGGALRQSGILAAAGIFALENHINRLADDHENAKILFTRIKNEIPQLLVEENSKSTNMIFFNVIENNLSGKLLLERCKKNGLIFSQINDRRFRMVTHLNISTQDIHNAIEILKMSCSEE